MEAKIRQLEQALLYSPSAVGHVKRHHDLLAKAVLVRGLAVFIFLCALFINLYAVSRPPEASLASSKEDIIYGGIAGDDENARQALQRIIINNQNPGGDQQTGIAAIYSAFNINAETISSAKEYQLCLSCSDTVHELRVVSRQPADSRQDELIVDGNRYSLLPISNVYKGIDRIKVLEINQGLFVAYSSGNIITVKQPDYSLSVSTVRIDRLGNIITSGEQAAAQRIFIENKDSRPIHDVKLGIAFDRDDFETVTYPNHNKLDFLSLDDESALVSWKQAKPNQQPLYFDVAAAAKKQSACVDVTVSSLETQNQQLQLCWPKQDQDTAADKNTLAADIPETPPEQLAAASPAISLEAFNQTRNSDATKTTAAAGDTIIYRLHVRNTSAGEQTYVLDPLSLNDLNEYAQLTEIGDSTIQGTLLYWPETKLDAGQSKTYEITARINETLPQTPQSSSNTNSYDCKISTPYNGRNAVITIQCPPLKTVEQSMSNLPYLGGPQSVALSVGLVALAAMLYYRQKQLVHYTKLALERFSRPYGVTKL